MSSSSPPHSDQESASGKVIPYNLKKKSGGVPSNLFLYTWNKSAPQSILHKNVQQIILYKLKTDGFKRTTITMR